MRFVFPLILLLAACATPPATQRANGPLRPLAAAAIEEWQAWGSVTREGWPTDRPADTAATPARFARLISYWEAVPGGEGVAARLRAQRATVAQTLSEEGSTDGNPNSAASGPEDIAIYAYPFWSAAFISSIARKAGIWHSDLPSAQSHARYIDAALARAAEDPAQSAFVPHDIAEYSPKPGDLLCADRSAVPLVSWTDRLAETGRSRPMHCDVVVNTAPGVVEAVGGNVEEMVVKRRFPADRQGHVLQAPSGQSQFFVVLAAR